MDNTITQTATTQAQIVPEVAIQMLKEGNERFVENKLLNRDLLKQVSETSDGQFPFAAVVSCIDSRIPTEVVFDQGVGDIFNARVAGNIVNEDVLGSLEFACKIAGAKLIVVLGHTSCGAVKGACDDAQLGNLTSLLGKIKPAIEQVKLKGHQDCSSANSLFVNQVAEKNVELTIDNIIKNSEVLREMLVSGDIKIVGAMYDVKNGSVVFSY